MKLGDLLVKILREDVDLSAFVLVRVLFVVKFELGQDLVCERARHDERRVAGGTSQVKKTSFGQDNNSVAFSEDKLVNLGLDVNALGGLHETVHVNFVIKVTDVSDNGVVLHLFHVVLHQDTLVSSGSDEDISGREDILESGHCVTFHAGLKGADGVNFGNVNNATVSTHGVCASLTNITVSADDGLLSGKHDIGGTHDTIGKRMLASVQVIKLGLGDGVIDIDSGKQERPVLLHGVQSVDTGSGFLGNSLASGSDLVPLVGLTGFEDALDDGEHNLEFGIVGSGGIGENVVFEEKILGLLSFVNEEGHVTTVINDKIRSVSLAIIIGPGESIQGAFPVFVEGLSLPGENGGGFITSNGGGSVILGGENVARTPSDIGSELVYSLNKDGSLDGHVKRSRNTGSRKRLGRSVFSTARHESRHLNLSEFNVLATVVGKGNIGNFVISGGHG
mmetsp:Transcript_1265/g.2855  ORF Transcript_1265/g.2855 Transcript_1265/m.2855 type:complete len:449 (-) Transcript_1265:279-1625(-)